MSRNGNGKIAIAIVAMFVVALSIIGFTYAYFTAQINVNTETKSVTVQAGKLEVTYEAGKTINAQGIVPGWVSDGKSYFDPTKKDEQGHIIAQHIDDGLIAPLTKENIDSAIQENDYAKKEYGLIGPADFTVKNSGTIEAYYTIKLINIKNTLEQIDSWNDKKHLNVKLYKGIYKIEDKLSDKENDILWNDVLADNETNQQIPKVFKVNVGDTNHLYLVLEYQNDDTHDQSKNMGKSVSATVEVVGVTKDPNNSQHWIDSSGNTIVDESIYGHNKKVVEELGNNE